MNLVFHGLFGIISSLAFGYLLMKLAERNNWDASITKIEYVICSTVIALIIIPLTLYWGWNVAKNNQLDYVQNLNGWEIKAYREDIKCERNGICRWEYDCDSYTVLVSYECNCTTDKNGVRKCGTCYRTETRWNSCPYVAYEYTYKVTTTLGPYTIAENRLPVDFESHRYVPSEYRYNRDKLVPVDVQNRAGLGEPLPWKEAYDRVNSGRPGPVTKIGTYKNFILASDYNIFIPFSGDIPDFKKLNLLPALKYEVVEPYTVNKLYLVGINFSDKEKKEWQDEVRYLASLMGTELQGDLVLVLTANNEINSNPDAYALALRAYWSNKRVFGNKTLAKNMLVVLVGTTDRQNVSWARGFTLMPKGNEYLLEVLKTRLPGITLSVESLLGRARVGFSSPTTPPLVPIYDSGKIQDLVFGKSDPSSRFIRVRMSFYSYLEGEVTIPFSSKIWIQVIGFFLSGLAWAVALFIDSKR